MAPSVAINTYNRSTFINIRGVGIAQSAPTSNPGVAYYVDGMFIPHEQFIAQSFYDIESIEVLRGPQGTLTGQNSTGGAIYVRTPAPQCRWLFRIHRPDSGRYGLVSHDCGGQRARGREVRHAAFGRVRRTRQFHATTSGRARATRAAAAMLRDAPRSASCRPTSMTFDLRYEHFDRKTDYNAIKNRNDAVTSDPFTIEEDAISFLNQKGDRASLEARFELTSGRSHCARSRAISTPRPRTRPTATARPPRCPCRRTCPPMAPTRRCIRGRVSFTTQELRTWVSEINLLSSGDSALQWVVGAFYLDEESPVSVLRDNRNTVDFVQSNSSIITELSNTSASVFGQVD